MYGENTFCYKYITTLLGLGSIIGEDKKNHEPQGKEKTMKPETTKTETSETVRTRHGYNPTEWRKFAENLRNLDIVDELVEFDRDQIENVPNWCARRFNPRTGTTWTNVSPSWSCSEDEYYSQHGPSSTLTLKSGSLSNTPGPGDGYEWELSETGSWWGNDDGDYFDEQNIDQKVRKMEGYGELTEGSDLEKFIKTKGYYRFDVGSTPVEPVDYSRERDELEKELEKLAIQCEKVADELESKNEDE